MQRMCLDNIHNVLALAIQRSAGAVSTSQVMASFSTTRRTLQLAAERLIISQEQDLPSALLRLKREVRNDKLPQAWFDFAIAFWSHESVARESEISKRRIRNPYTRKDKATYGLHFLTVLLPQRLTYRIFFRCCQHMQEVVKIATPDSIAVIPQGKSTDRHCSF